MKQINRILVLTLVAMIPLVLYAAMKEHNMMAPKGMEKTYTGIISGNECATMGMKCEPSHMQYETPVFIPEENGKLDFKHVYYLSGLPVSVQDEAFLKEVKLTGTFYPSISTVAVKTMDLKNGKEWKPFVMSKNGTTEMACCPKGTCCAGKGQACCHLHPAMKM